MSPARRCASITSGRDCTALRKRSSQSASCCEVRISTKKQLSSPSFSGSSDRDLGLDHARRPASCGSGSRPGSSRRPPGGRSRRAAGSASSCSSARMFRSRSSSAAAIPRFLRYAWTSFAIARSIAGRFPYLKPRIETFRENVLSCGAERCRGQACDTTRSFSIFATAASSSPAPGAVAVAKLRLLLKTEARIVVYGADAGGRGARLGGRGPDRARRARARGRRRRRRGAASTAPPATPAADARAAAIGRAAGALVNIVDDLEDSDFITPAIVDRDPVTVAIGTEGAAPVLARKIKAEVEAMLPATLGRLDPHRPGLPRPGRGARFGRARRAFWTRFYFERGPRALAAGEDAARDELERDARRGRRAAARLRASRRRRPGRPRAPDAEGAAAAARGRRRRSTTGWCRRRSSSSPGARRRSSRSARPAYGPSWKQDDINALLVRHAARRRQRGAAQGRRSGGLRPARRGDRGAGGGGHRLRGRARHHRGERGGGGDRPVADQARAQLGASAS